MTIALPSSRCRFKHPLAHRAVRLSLRLSYSLVAEQLGLTRSQVAGFCMRYQRRRRKPSPTGHTGPGPYWFKQTCRGSSTGA